MIVTTNFNINAPQEISAEALARLDAIKDEDIDYSDIPELDDNYFKNAVPFREYMAKKAEAEQKTEISLELEKDIAEWLEKQREQGSFDVNIVFRQAMSLQRMFGVTE